jgi:hypothetical protein
VLASVLRTIHQLNASVVFAELLRSAKLTTALAPPFQVQ